MAEVGPGITGYTHSLIGRAIGFGIDALHPLVPVPRPALVDVHLVRGFGPMVGGVLLILLGALIARVPDLDLQLRLPHRGVTHSLVAAAAVTVFVWSVAGALLPAPAALEPGALAGAVHLSHIAADSVNPMPVAVLWRLPRRRPRWLPSVREESLAGRAVDAATGC